MCLNPTLRAWADPAREDLSILMGACCGDVAGSVYEMRNIRYRLDEGHLISPNAHVTDDTVLTCAVARALAEVLPTLPADWLHTGDIEAAEAAITESARVQIHSFGCSYPTAGYGSKFEQWLLSGGKEPYGSWGNGSAMRVSPAGWLARSLEEAERLGEITAAVTHNHPEGVKGAKVVAGCLYLLRQSPDKEAVRAYAARHYDIGFTLDGIRDTYTFNASCQGSVPQAIVAFLEAADFADAISGAISIGGDSDTIAAIAGCLAEVIYPIPEGIRAEVTARMAAPLLAAIDEAVDCARNAGK